MCEDCKPNPQRSGEMSEDDKLNLATIFLILSPFIGIMIACFIIAIFS